MTFYHIAYAADWAEAQKVGQYTMSTKGRTLEEQGFIHGGTVDQVAPVANMIYGGDDGLIVLVIDEGRLTSELKYDDVPGWDSPFPHIYGPLNVDAVADTIPLVKGDDGKFQFSV
jgi:uncharacterized protein (DUF952 family)